jgi:hypothetical protein
MVVAAVVPCEGEFRCVRRASAGDNHRLRGIRRRALVAPGSVSAWPGRGCMGLSATVVVVAAPAYRDDRDQTVIPLADAPALAELADRARAHEPITLTQTGAQPVLLMSAEDHRAVLDWDAAFVADTLAAPQPAGPYLPDALVAAMDTAAPERVEAFLTELETHAGEDLPAAQQWATWERTATA